MRRTPTWYPLNFTINHKQIADAIQEIDERGKIAITEIRKSDIIV